VGGSAAITYCLISASPAGGTDRLEHGWMEGYQLFLTTFQEDICALAAGWLCPVLVGRRKDSKRLKGIGCLLKV